VTKNGRANAIVTWLGVAVALVGISVLWSLLPLRDWIINSAAWFRGSDVGLLAFFLGFVFAVVALVPASVPIVAAGLIFGFWVYPLALVAATLGAAGAFLIARYVARDKVRGLVGALPKTRAVYRAVGEGGWKMVWLLRLVPLMPFTLLNYVLGVTEVGFRTYLTATAVGIIPSVAFYLYLGVLGRAAIDGTEAGILRWVLLIVGLAATLGVIWYVSLKARDELRKYGLDTP
jgi:uncharacterized membrane protein YdjX (TVP38/TMEM64 family)